MSNHLVAVIVCLDYSDYLEHTLRVNQPLFDDLVIVTAQEDKGTLAVCERYGARPVLCPYFKRKGSFNKALAINLGLAHLDLTDTWILQLDADTALPRNTRKLLWNSPLDPLSIYGVDRVECPSYEEWIGHLVEPDPAQKHYFLRPPRGWKLGTRLLHHDYGDYVPIGFFQLWHSASGITRYPTVQNSSAEHTDVLHALQWPPERRHLFPSIMAVHLGTGPAVMGANWNGRSSPPFGPLVGRAVAVPEIQQGGVDDGHHHHPPHPHPHPKPPYRPC